MKVSYDITTLGSGHYHSSARTGIFRVAESLALGLKKSHQCEMSFCATGSPANLTKAFDYLAASPDLSDVPLIGSSKGLVWELRRKLYSTFAETNFKVDETSGVQKIPLRAKRKLLHHAALLSEALYDPDQAALFSNLDIYHSPFQAIPPYIDEIKHLQTFLTVHDLIPILYPEWFPVIGQENFTNQAISSLTHSSWVQCVSQSTKNDLCNHLNHLDPDRVFVTYLAASDRFYPCPDADQFNSIRAKYGIPDAPYILSLSTLEPRKNISHALRCFFQLIQQENIPDLNFVLAGGKGWKYDSIFSELSDNPKLKQRVILTGYIADEDLASLYTNALAFIYISLYEGFGLPPLEAMKCGTPVITSNTSSLPEVVGDAGIMVNPTDVDALCESMAAVYQRASFREQLSLKSIEQSKQFSWERCTQETISAYKESLNS